MQKRFTAIYIVIIALLFSACDYNNKEKSMQLSTELTTVNDSLFYLGKTWNDEFKLAVNAKDFSRLQGLRTSLQQFIENKETRIKKIEDVGGSEAYRQAELDILQFERETVLPKFVIFESFNENTTDEEIAEAYNMLVSTLNEEQEKLGVIYKLRDEYAEKNEFPKPLDK